MNNQLHPAIDDILHSVVQVVYRRYRAYVEKADLSQEAWAWSISRADTINDQLSEDSDIQRVINEKKIAWQMKRVLERYCRKEKAVKSGYQTNDEAFYDTVTIAQLLPYVIASVVSDTALEQAQNLVNDGQPRKPSAPAEGGNLLATLVDIKKAYIRLDNEEQDILRLRYHDNITLQQLSEYLECAISTADRRVGNALRKLQNNIGGESPWQ